MPPTSQDYDELQRAIRKGQLPVIRQIWHRFPQKDMSMILHRACVLGQLEIVQWFWETECLPKGFDYRGAFYKACQHGHLELARWFWETIGPSLAVRSVNHGHLFDLVCLQGQLAVAQWLWTLEEWRRSLVHPFNWVCYNGDLVIARWLWSLGELPLSALMDGLGTVCPTGRLEVAQWLYSLHDTPPAIPIYTLNGTCQYYQVAMVEWLLEVGGYEPDALCTTLTVAMEAVDVAKEEQLDDVLLILDLILDHLPPDHVQSYLEDRPEGTAAMNHVVQWWRRRRAKSASTLEHCS